MSGVAYLLRRLALGVVVLFCVSILTFSATRLVPADPAALFAGPRPTPAQIEQARERLGLDRPLPEQYALFMGRALTGDFGVSFKTKRPILEDIASFLPATLELVVAATLLAVLIGVPAGVLAGARPGGWFDQATRLLAIGGVSVPTFWLAMILQLVFFGALGWLPLSGRVSQDISLFNPIPPVTGFNSIDAVIAGNWKGLVDSLHHLVLPAVTLAAYPVGLALRMTRGAMVEALGERYITAARAMGLRPRTILFAYALKNALVPTVTVLALSFAFSLTGAFLVEVIFAWPGLGRYTTEAILNVDFPVIMAVTLVATAIYVFVNIAVDLLQATIDPRVELKVTLAAAAPSARPKTPVRRLLGDPIAVIGLAIIIPAILAILFAPFLTDHAAQGLGQPNIAEKLQPPSAGHWFGTDHLGRDLWARVLYGGRVSLSVALLVVLLSIVIGVPLGTVAGYYGGWVDEAIMRLTDVFLAFPPLLLAIFLAALLGPGFLNAAIAIALGWWPWYARIARAQVLSLRCRPFVEAAEIMGVRHATIMRRHLLPGVASPVLVQATLDFGSAILTAAALSFLGLGVAPPTADWGQMVSNGRTYFPDRWWYVTFPGLAIFLVTLASNVIGDGLQAAIDPRRRR